MHFARSVSPLLLLCACGVLCAESGFAQDGSTGAIRGTVVDPGRRRIVGASIALVNVATGYRYSSRSDGEGVFYFQLLPAGDYSARASSRAMSPQLTLRLHVDIGAVTQVAFALTIDDVKE